MKNSAASLLTSVDSLFTTQEERNTDAGERVVRLPIDEITDYPGHPFKVRMDARMTELIESVKKFGVLEPVLVRPHGNAYEMVAGHRRRKACISAGLTHLPCIVRDLTDDEATIIMVDSNLQREEILPSEKGFAYRMKLEAMKRQGMRTDLTSDPVGQKSGISSRAMIASDSKDSYTQIQRFIRITYLAEPLRDMVDENKIALRPAVELSYLSENEQDTLLETMEMEACTPSHEQARKIRRFSEEGKLNAEVILSIMQEEKPNQKEVFRMPRERISRFFKPDTPPQVVEDTIIKALELYRKRQREQAR